MKAHKLKKRLDAAPGLTRDALAKEIGLDPSRLTKILRLLNLAPEIQRYVSGMRPAKSRGPLTGRRLMWLAGIPDMDSQVQNFRRLLR